MSKIYMHTLGCAKNTVNTEQMLALLLKAGHIAVMQPDDAEVAVVNTCGFIDTAKSEAIEAILSLARLKREGGLKALIACGCLTERYKDDFSAQLPEVDAILGVGSYTDIVAAVEAALAPRQNGGCHGFFAPKQEALLDGPRALTSPGYWAWLKIAEGCDNRCAYCAIPDIRGPFRSRSMESVVDEARQLAEAGVKEIILIAQDTTRYGLDIYGRLALADLLKKLEAIKDIRWIRIHYLYPDEISEELLDVIAASQKIVHYFDIPMQHISDMVLTRMNRRGGSALIRRRIEQIRAAMPDAIIRTSLIAGFPGETQEDFDRLYDFLQLYRLERVGIFCYSQEEGTPAANMPGQVSEETCLQRQEALYMLQQEIMEQHGQSLVSRRLEVLCCGKDAEGRVWGRSYMDSPDVDGAVYFDAGQEGHFYDVEILWADGCDLYGKRV